MLFYVFFRITLSTFRHVLCVAQQPVICMDQDKDRSWTLSWSVRSLLPTGAKTSLSWSAISQIRYAFFLWYDLKKTVFDEKFHLPNHFILKFSWMTYFFFFVKWIFLAKFFLKLLQKNKRTIFKGIIGPSKLVD